MNEDMKNRSTMEILTKTMPMIMVRMGANILKGVIAFLVFGIFFGIGAALRKMTHGRFDPTIFTFIAVIAVMAVVYFINHWVMYLIKAGHVSVIAYYMAYGCLPEEGQVEYAKRTVKENFITTNVGFGFDSLIRGATNQGLSVLNRVEDFLDFIPGIGTFMWIVKFFIKTVTNYVDEAVMAYIYIKNDESNVWKKTADGIVLYVQNWKAIFKASAKVAIGVVAIKAFMLFLIIGFLTPLMHSKGFFIGIIVAILLWAIISATFIEPVVVIIMIKDYIYASSQSEVSYDLYGQMQDCSSKFKEIVSRSI
ncbi:MULTISPECIES: hypothetical protein [Clostridium]|uniref:AI-2E family transporter n=1 Tax=Clostridium cibarium TaxID=2762247 RepID=A0ABR8PPN3_9CLOT|nr:MULTISPECIES: hypothetical protein [Clostridium]MBD7910123.1 hypothetical protein [Clostridium cibarium]